MVATEWKLRWFRLTLGYEVTALILTSVNQPLPGTFDPGAQVRCVDARYAIEEFTERSVLLLNRV